MVVGIRPKLYTELPSEFQFTITEGVEAFRITSLRPYSVGSPAT